MRFACDSSKKGGVKVVKILLVDDEKGVVDMMKSYFEMVG